MRGLRSVPGCSVADTSALGDGFGDIVIGFRGVNFIIEIKDGAKSPSRRKLTKAETDFHQTWTGQIAVAESLDDCLRVIGVIT